MTGYLVLVALGVLVACWLLYEFATSALALPEQRKRAQVMRDLRRTRRPW